MEPVSFHSDIMWRSVTTVNQYGTSFICTSEIIADVMSTPGLLECRVIFWSAPAEQINQMRYPKLSIFSYG